jgi:hypothetical protein
MANPIDGAKSATFITASDFNPNPLFSLNKYGAT